jgi:hypothetical protein
LKNLTAFDFRVNAYGDKHNSLFKSKLQCQSLVRQRFESFQFGTKFNPLSLKTKAKSVTAVHNTMKVNM